MLSRSNHHQWLFLLAAIVLAMQSFALWHDAVHPFHIATTQCEQTASISHSPSDLTPSTLSHVFITAFTETRSSRIMAIQQRVTHRQNIRAPPIFS